MYDSNLGAQDGPAIKSAQPSQSYLPDYQGPAVTDGLRGHVRQPDPQLANSFLPDYQGPASRGNANYANAPANAQYANNPTNANPYGVAIDASQTEAAFEVGEQNDAVPPQAPQTTVQPWVKGVIRDLGGRAEPPAPQQPPSQQSAPAQARVRRPLPPLPNQDVSTSDGVDRIVTEKRNSNDPQGPNERSFSRVPDQAQFQGRIIMQKASNVMVLRSTASEGDKRSETLIHLPESATKQLRADANSRKMLDASMTYGTDSKPLDISYDKGKWSVAQAPDAPHRSHA